MEKFNEMLGTKADRLFFGYKAFEIAYDKNAIKTLIVTDGYLRTISPLTRKDLSAKIKDLKLDTNVTVCQFSSKHVTGEKIDEFGGICGILKYVVEEISELGQEDNDKKEEEVKKINDSKSVSKEGKKENKKEDKKEDKKEEKGKNQSQKTNKTNNQNKNISQSKINFKRKRSPYEDDEDYEDDYDDYDDDNDDNYDDDEYDDYNY